LPYYPIHTTLDTEQRLSELDHNLGVYRRVVQETAKSEFFSAKNIQMGEPIVIQEKEEKGSTRKIFTKITDRNVGYLVEEIAYDANDAPLDYSAEIKIPAMDVEANDLALDETERPVYEDRHSQWDR
jgi:hypothetical protein